MSVDIEKLRAMHAATTQGRWFKGLEYGTLFCSGRAELLGVGHSHGYGQWGAFVNARDSEFVADVHEAVIPLCDRVERVEAEVERLRAENARLAGELAVLRGTARPAGGPGRCTVCGWPLAESRDKGCVEGDCSYRPRGGA